MPSEGRPQESNEQVSGKQPQYATDAALPNASGGHAHGGEPSVVRKFLISLDTMDVPLRVLTGIVIAEVAASVFLIVAKDHLTLISFDMGGGQTLTLPTVTYFVTVLIVVGGLYLLTRGMFEATGTGRLIFLGVLLAFYSTYLGLFVGALFRSYMFQLLATLFYCGVAAGVVRLYRERYSPERQSRIFIWAVVLVMTSSPLALLFEAPKVFTYYLILLWYPLPIFYALAGTDWAEILDAIAQSFLKSRMDKASSGWLAGAGIVVCCGFATWMMISSRGDAWNYAPAIAGAVFFVAVIVWVAGINESWDREFSWAGLTILTATFIFLLLGVPFFTGSAMALPFWTVCFSVVAGFLLILFARRAKFAGIWPVLLFGMILGMFWAALGSLGGFIGMAIPQTAIWGTMFGIATASLLGIIGLLWLWREGNDVHDALLYTILLNVGCAALYALYGIYEGALELSKRQQLIQAIVVFVALIWDIFISGHSITNADGKMFSRRSRVYLFFGYIFLVTATIVFWDSGAITKNGIYGIPYPSDLGPEIQSVMDPEGIVVAGIVSFGPAALLTLFLLRLAKWLPRRRGQPALAGRG
ncbi:MAG: hypothetical protein WA581_01110 [Candidatus Acidiferrales bacterium]